MARTGHWLRPNETEWSPPEIATLDTETVAHMDGDAEVHTLRCWALATLSRRVTGSGAPAPAIVTGDDADGLVAALEAAVVGRPTLWVFAHNLAFDLATTRLLDRLAETGWDLTDLVVTQGRPRATLRRASKRLRLLDSYSWLPEPLKVVGEALGEPKGAMPGGEATLAAWRAYCARDAEVLVRAMAGAMDWWDAQRLGHWGTSGPSTGWAAMRHMTPARSLVIRTDEEGRAADRRAVYGGRRDATRWGDVEGGPFALIDFRNAYATIAATQLLPACRLGRAGTETTRARWWDNPAVDLIATATLRTERPRYPCRVAGMVTYPVGTFTTTLCGPELREADAAGELVELHECWLHQLARPLELWGGWALDLLEAPTDDCPDLARIMVKGWARSVVGKFAGRSSRTIDRGPALWPHWHLERGTYGPMHLPTHEVHCAGRYVTIVGDQEADNAYPALFAWVESYCRRALTSMLEHLGEDAWVLCDTDGAVIDIARAARVVLGERSVPRSERGLMDVTTRVCTALAPAAAPLEPRCKMVARTAHVAGPQHYHVGRRAIAAGRPRHMDTAADGQQGWWVWPKLAWQMAQSRPDGYVRVQQDWSDPTITTSRWAMADGRTVAPRVTLDDQGRTELVGSAGAGLPGGADRLAQVQVPALERLRR